MLPEMWWNQDSKAPSATSALDQPPLGLRRFKVRRAVRSAANREEAPLATTRERTKEQLYREAKKMGIKGRSKMNKGQLKAAVDRRR
jgi:hypothetical protein